jgi:hypothetical protein
MPETQPTVTKSVRLSPELYDEVKALGGDFSENTRAALRDYIAYRKKRGALKDPSSETHDQGNDKPTTSLAPLASLPSLPPRPHTG